MTWKLTEDKVGKQQKKIQTQEESYSKQIILFTVI